MSLSDFLFCRNFARFHAELIEAFEGIKNKYFITFIHFLFPCTLITSCCFQRK